MSFCITAWQPQHVGVRDTQFNLMGTQLSCSVGRTPWPRTKVLSTTVVFYSKLTTAVSLFLLHPDPHGAIFRMKRSYKIADGSKLRDCYLLVIALIRTKCIRKYIIVVRKLSFDGLMTNVATFHMICCLWKAKIVRFLPSEPNFVVLFLVFCLYIFWKFPRFSVKIWSLQFTFQRVWACVCISKN